MPAALILTLDAALDGCSAAVVRGNQVVAARAHPGGRGSAAALPELARAVLAEAGIPATGLEGIAVTVGPGSFTGVRAALALAQGLGLAAGVPVHGVSIGAAIRAQLDAGGTPVWVVIDSRRDRVFLDADGTPVSVAVADLPDPAGPVWLAGDAVDAVATELVRRGHAPRRTDVCGATPAGIAAAVRRSPGPATPLYIDPVEARPGPAGRPAPQPSPS